MTTSTTMEEKTKVIEPQKQSFVAVEENEDNENVFITYEIIDENTKKNLYMQDFHTMSQFVVKSKDISDSTIFVVADSDAGTVNIEKSASSKKPWISITPINKETSAVAEANIICYGSHYIFGSSSPTKTKSGCKIDYNTFDTRKQL